MNKEEFYAALKKLETRFEKMEPELETTLRDPAAGVEGYIVVWNTGICAGGPLEFCGKGGTRITPEVTLDEVKMLARRMALKNAAAGLPLGGSKSGLKADPNAGDFEKKYRRFAQLCKPLLFENGGVFGGFGFDIGARPVHPHWICDELGSLRCFTGKPVEMGGTDYDREGIAGLGVAVAAKAALEADNKNAKGAAFAVQGAGAMGGAVIRYFSEFGGVLKAVADPRLGGTWIFGEEGAPAALLDALGRGAIDIAHKLLQDSDYEHLPEDTTSVLYQDVDILFPCAVQDVVTKDNAAKIIATYLVEGANGPCTAEAHKLLHDKNVIVIPDFIANPGGIIAAYVEMTSPVSPAENEEKRTKVNEAKTLTKIKIAENVQRLMKLVRDLDVSPVQAGMYLALQSIFACNGKEACDNTAAA